MTEKGLIQVYTGKGKGKTTAALGVSLRTLIRGGSVYFAQFIKGKDTAELALSDYFEKFVITQFGNGYFIDHDPSDEDAELVKTGFLMCMDAASSGDYDLVVLDEVNVALHYGLLDIKDVRVLIDKKSPDSELILTGRYATPGLIEMADLVTEMKKVKHYFDVGVKARKGIEF